MDFDDEDLEINSRPSNNNNNNYDESNQMQDPTMPTVRPGTAPRNPLGRQNSGLYCNDSNRGEIRLARNLKH